MKPAANACLLLCTGLLILIATAMLLSIPKTTDSASNSRWQEAETLGVKGRVLQPLTLSKYNPQAMAALEQSVEEAKAGESFWLYKHFPQLAQWEAKLQHAN